MASSSKLFRKNHKSSTLKPGSVAYDLQATMAEDANSTCMDCRSGYPTHASVSFAIFVCPKCASAHRRLGVKHSFVLSLSHDTWTVSQAHRMRLGGNKRFVEFLKRNRINEYGKISKKYMHKTSQEYRKLLDSLCETVETVHRFATSSLNSMKQKQETKVYIPANKNKRVESEPVATSPEQKKNLERILTTKSAAVGTARRQSSPLPMSKSDEEQKKKMLHIEQIQHFHGVGTAVGTGREKLGPALVILSSSSEADENETKSLHSALDLENHWHMFLDVDHKDNGPIGGLLMRSSSSLEFPQLFILDGGHFWFIGDYPRCMALSNVSKLAVLTAPAFRETDENTLSEKPKTNRSCSHPNEMESKPSLADRKQQTIENIERVGSDPCGDKPFYRCPRKKTCSIELSTTSPRLRLLSGPIPRRETTENPILESNLGDARIRRMRTLIKTPEEEEEEKPCHRISREVTPGNENVQWNPDSRHVSARSISRSPRKAAR